MEPGGRVHFLANACHVCMSKTTPNVCEICKMIFYCSPEHRRENWFDHSEICWAISKISGGGRREGLWGLFDGKDLPGFCHGVAIKCTELLKRSLRPWELEMIYHPRMCNVCREFDWSQLSTCKNCEFVFTCRKNHFRKDHKRWCATLKTYSDLTICQNLGNDIKPIDLEIENKFYKSMADVLSENSEYKNSQLQTVLTSELLTYPLTVLNGLRAVDALRERELVVLLIGAELQAEVEPLYKWEKYLMHFLDDVQCLTVRFLGPELQKSSQEFSANLCEACRKCRKNLKFQFISEKFYHEYSTTGNEPNLICAFNSGMYRDFGFRSENSWKETIEKLFARGSPPVLVTEYTCHELKMVLKRIESSCGDVRSVVRPEENPFASWKPGLNIISSDEVPVIFKNYFYTILISSKS